MAASGFQGAAAPRARSRTGCMRSASPSPRHLPISSSMSDCEGLRSGCPSRVSQGGQAFPTWEFGDREDWKRSFHHEIARGHGSTVGKALWLAQRPRLLSAFPCAPCPPPPPQHQ